MKTTYRPKILFLKSLASLINSGHRLSQALDTAGRDLMGPDLEKVVAQIQQGRSLWEALASLPDSFEESEVQYLKAGEECGSSVVFLTRLAEDLAILERLNRGLSAKNVPIIMGLTFLCFLPGLFFTRTMSAFFEFSFPLFLGLSLLLLSCWLFFNKLKHGFVLRLSGKSKVSRNLALSQFLFTLGELLECGISQHKSVSLSASSPADEELRTQLEQLSQHQKENEPLSKQLEPYLSSSHIQALEMAERSGNTIEKIKEISGELRQESDLAAKSLPKRMSNFLLVTGLLWLALGTAYGKNTLPTPPSNSHEASLEGKLFAVDTVDNRTVVVACEDLTLFEVTAWSEQDPSQRAQTLAKRLNVAYQSPCLECKKSALEPEDIKVGRFDETNDTVIFYCHMHGPIVHWGPELLITVTENQAEALESTPRFLATYWRDLLRDIVLLSRGMATESTFMGDELTESVTRARQKMSAEKSDVSNFKQIFLEISGPEAKKLRKLFLNPPKRAGARDLFRNVEGYSSLTL